MNEQSRNPNRKLARVVALGLAFTVCGVGAKAQEATKLPRIGYLAASPPTSSPARTEAFRQGLRELGYTEGKNIQIEYRWAEGKVDRLPHLASELVRLKADAIVSGGNSATESAKKATNTIPIVMAQANDPVASGFVASLAHPGGNITGLSTLSPQLSGKRLELLREIVPRLSRVAVIDNSAAGNTQVLRETEHAAEALGIKLQYVDVRSPKDIETAFREASKARADAVLMLPNPVHFSQRTQIAELAIKSRLPVIYGRPEYVEAGGLVNYGVSFTDLDRRAATFVDKILKGANPATLPLKLKLEEIETQLDSKGLETAFQTAKQKQVNAIMTTSTRAFFAERKRIVELAGKYRFPAIYFQKEFVDEGGLMSYGADFDDIFRRAAVYVDKILKGAKPADLPVQQATKFEFIINLKAAKQIGLIIPINVLERANKVIK
jgi:putative ABC transport system substrate-binding protein